MKYYLIYENQRTNDVSLVGEFNRPSEAYDNIKQFNIKTGFESYYIRVTENENEDNFWVDFGSHFRFYHIAFGKEAADRIMKKLKGELL